MKPTNGVQVLPIRIRRILTGDGATISARTVFCPTHGRAVAVATCGECQRCDQVGHETVSCRFEPTGPMLRWSSVLHRMLPAAADRVAIAAVMSRDVTCVTADVSVEAVTTLFLDRGFGAAPVVDAEGSPIGMISKTDLVRRQFEVGDTVEVGPPDDTADGMHLADVGRVVVGDVMMPLAFTLAEDQPLSNAAAVMATEGIHHLPIVDGDGRVVGILSSLDFVRWVANQSGYSVNQSGE